MDGSQRGDSIVCCFRIGHEGNPISLAPDGAIAILDRSQRGTVKERVPYVCTVKALGSTHDGKRSYVVRLDHALGAGDYDEPVHADFQARRVRVRLRYPTYFASLRTRLVDADTEEEAVLEDGRPVGVLVRLRHGPITAEAEFTPEEAVRRGARINELVPPNHGASKDPPRIQHPRPRSPEADWRPRPVDTVGYLARSTAELAATVPLALQSLGEDELQERALHRATEVTALRAYDVVSPESPDAIALELALTATVRLACLTHDDPRARKRLALAEKRLFLRRSAGMPAAWTAAQLERLDLDARLDDEAVSIPLRAYLDATPGRRDGAWNLARLEVKAGRVRLPTHLAKALLADQVHEGLRRETVTAPDDILAFLQPVKDRITHILGLLDADTTAAREAPCAFDAYPPCITNTLHRAPHHALTEAETQNALGFLTQIGVPATTACRSLDAATDDERYRTRNATGRLTAKHVRALPCQVNRLLGTCHWDCGTKSPLEHHAEAVA